MIQVAVGGSWKFKCPKANVVKRFVIDAVSFVCVFYELMDWQGGVVGLYYGVGYLEKEQEEF